MKKILPAAALALFLAGCATSPSEPLNAPSAAIDSKLVAGELKVLCDKPEDCQMFELSLKNKTAQTIEIDWNRSYYINNGKPDGGIYFDGIVIAQRNQQRPPDLLLANGTFNRKLIPSNNLELKVFPLARWSVKNMAGARHGVYLSLKAGNQEEVVNVSVDLPKK